MQTIDFVILAIYAVAIFGLAQWVSRDKGGKQKDANDYFLAGKALPWWAIGASPSTGSEAARRQAVSCLCCLGKASSDLETDDVVA